MDERALRSRPAPVSDYEEAVEELNRLGAQEEGEINPLCRPVILTHGRKTEKAVLWFHGYTNCPRQFETLARACFDQGWNTWIPRAPFHGLKDRMSEATSFVTAEGLARFADRAVDIARGLGKRVVVGGISAGGSIAAWLGQQRTDIDLALPIAPFLSPVPGPLLLSRLLALTTRLLPDRLIWWDPVRKESLEGPAHVYFRYSTKGVGEILTLGLAFVDMARKAAPAARRFRFVLNENDETLNNAPAERLLALWRRRGATHVEQTRFSKRLGLRHDLIEPQQPDQKVDLVYPVIIDLIRGETNGSR